MERNSLKTTGKKLHYIQKFERFPRLKIFRYFNERFAVRSQVVNHVSAILPWKLFVWWKQFMKLPLIVSSTMAIDFIGVQELEAVWAKNKDKVCCNKNVRNWYSLRAGNEILSTEIKLTNNKPMKRQRVYSIHAVRLEHRVSSARTATSDSLGFDSRSSHIKGFKKRYWHHMQPPDWQ